MKTDVFNSAGQYLGRSGMAVLCKDLADEWFREYCEVGKLTSELEAEREKIMALMREGRQKQKA